MNQTHASILAPAIREDGKKTNKQQMMNLWEQHQTPTVNTGTHREDEEVGTTSSPVERIASQI
jgi:hypothetical protein